MEHDVSNYPAPIRRIMRSEDTRIGFFAAWFLALCIFPTGGFYLFTIASPASDAHGIRHYYDLRVADIHFGGVGALVGLGLGVILALWMTFIYPALKEREDEWDSAHGNLAHEEHATADRIHDAEGH